MGQLQHPHRRQWYWCLKRTGGIEERKLDAGSKGRQSSVVTKTRLTPLSLRSFCLFAETRSQDYLQKFVLISPKTSVTRFQRRISIPISCLIHTLSRDPWVRVLANFAHIILSFIGSVVLVGGCGGAELFSFLFSFRCGDVLSYRENIRQVQRRNCPFGRNESDPFKRSE